MDKKKMIAAIVAVVLAIAGALTQIDFKSAVCNVNAENSQAAK